MHSGGCTATARTSREKTGLRFGLGRDEGTGCAGGVERVLVERSTTVSGSRHRNTRSHRAGRIGSGRRGLQCGRCALYKQANAEISGSVLAFWGLEACLFGSDLLGPLLVCLF